MGDGGGGRFVDKPTGQKTIERKRGIDGMGLAGGQCMGKDMAGARRGLETARPPATIDKQTLDGRLADNGRPVGRHIDNATPVA